MRPRNATRPKQLSEEAVRPRAIEFRDFNAQTCNSSALVEQEDFAAHIVAVRFRLAPHLARLVCQLAGLGEVA
jgi:hypothetical protein